MATFFKKGGSHMITTIDITTGLVIKIEFPNNGK